MIGKRSSELDQHAVAHKLDDTPIMLGDLNSPLTKSSLDEVGMV